MKIEWQVQIEALRLLSTERGTCIRFAESEDGFVYFTTKGYCAVRIPTKAFWLDKSRLRKMDSLAGLFRDAIFSENELTIKSFEADKNFKTALAVLACDAFETTLDARLYNSLLKNGCKMYSKGKNKPVYFTLNDEAYAVCMPKLRKR